MSINSDRDIIQLIIDAENLAAPELKESSREILALGDDAQIASKKLDELKIKKSVITSFTETGQEVDKLRRELIDSEVAFDNLKQSLKETENATDSQKRAVVSANIELKAQRATLRTQETAYSKISAKAREFGVNTKNVAQEQQKLNLEIDTSKRSVDILNASYKKNSTTLKDKIVVENALQESYRKSEARVKALNDLDTAAAISINKSIKQKKELAAELTRVENATKQYEVSLKKLNTQYEVNELSAADLMRAESKLRSELNLKESQITTIRKAMRLETDARKESIAATAQQVNTEKLLAAEKDRVKAGLISYESSLKKLNAQYEVSELSAADLMRAEAKLRSEYKLTDAQVKLTRSSLKLETEERKRAIDKVKAQTASEAALRAESVRVTAAIDKYEIALRELNQQRDKGKISIADAIRDEKRLRNQYKLTEAQVKSSKAAIKAEGVARTASSRTTDKLTMATRRLAQVYTVLIAAQSAAAAVTTSVKNYGELEAAMVKVEKTTGNASAEIEKLTEDLIKLGEDITPTTTNELLRMSEVAGQLGIKGTGDLLKMVAAADALGVSTNLAGDEAATLLTRVLLMTGEGVGEINNLSSSVVSLGNNFAVTEAEIVHMMREIVTGTTSINLGSAAAAAYAATLKETGQTAERSRTAMFKLSQSIKDAVASGGNDLERLMKYTGQTADELEKNLGERPEKVLTDLITGLGKARENGENLSSVLNSMGVTGSEATSVVEALAKNHLRLNEALVMSNEQYELQNAHFIEASKSYATQDAALGRLINKFTNLTAKIGAAYSDETNSTINTASKLLDEQGERIIELMNLFGELGGAVTDIGNAIGGFGDILGKGAEDVSALDVVILGLRTTFNMLTIGINTVVLRIQQMVQAVATAINFFDDTVISDAWLKDYEKKVNNTTENIKTDFQDLKNAQLDFDRESSASYRDLMNVVDEYKGSVSALTEKEQEQLLTIKISGEYSEELNETYRKLTERLVSVSREQDILAKLEAKRLEGIKEKALADEAALVAARNEETALNNLSVATSELTI